MHDNPRNVPRAKPGFLSRFLAKSLAEKRAALRFRVRCAVSKIPLLPVPLRLVLEEDVVSFYWSRFLGGYDGTKKMWDYRGPDERELQFLARVLKPGMTFVDVGAYHGLYSVVAARLVGANGRVLTVEPSARERRRIRLNFWLNGLDARVEPMAICAASGEQKFFVVRSGFTTMNSLVRPAVSDPVKITVTGGMRMDEFCMKHGIDYLDVIKVDVEGGELGLFRGGSMLLRDIRPMIICEVLDWVTRPWGYQAREIVEYVEGFGYQFFDFESQGRLSKHSIRMAYPEVKNYLAVPSERVKEVESFCITKGSLATQL